MGCAVSCVNRATMSLFGRHNNDSDARAVLERKLYIAKESPEPDFDLSECQLRQVPSGTYSICKVYRKEHLYLHNNKLQSLEEGGQLSDLYLIKVINLSSNRFSYLPNDIRYLVNLTELYIQNNHIKTLPETIQYMQSLRIIDVSDNKLNNLTPSISKLKNLRKLNLTQNPDLNELCPELCLATNLTTLEIDGDQFMFPPSDIATQDTVTIIKYLCEKLNIEYCPPLSTEADLATVQTPTTVLDPFVRRNTQTWEEQEASIIEQENRLHKAAKEQRERFLNKVLQEQIELDSEIAKVHSVRENDRQKLIKAIQEEEKEITCLVNNFIQSDNLKPEIIQQQLAYEQSEHDRLLEITRQNYDNIKKVDVLRAMEMLIEEDYTVKHSKKYYEDSLNNMKQNMLIQDLEVSEKLTELLNAKDQSRTTLVEQLLEDQDIQKAIVASLLEKVDSRTWSLNQEISLISSHLARLSVIEQEKKKLQIAYNYNELLQQRVQLVNLLDDLFGQQNKRRKQLVETLREMETETNKSNDFWLKNYQRLIDSAPRSLLNVGKSLDPALANYLLQEGVIHCLPFLVKFLFSDEPLVSITKEDLKLSGVSLSSDREGIIRAINSYVGAKCENHNFEASTSVTPSAPAEESVDEQKFTGVVTMNSDVSVMEAECVICMDAQSEVVFVPCGHMCCCQSCSNKEMDSCPMCRSSIERIIKVMIA
ncbi:E3 ubiquitin-protein ligase LRSAM1-like [Trichoplusia ni]|uniref:E3 ubiquitin-protein ligase LRSAM1-like n=1 Tax=Trichoplusia ni TaxID=7111 RepID=A0A7E5VCE1_TRINI|nr:E3 ubiquitin-protein ligase LRSAM1-like [Trichoplusia ni]